MTDDPSPIFRAGTDPADVEAFILRFADAMRANDLGGAMKQPSVGGNAQQVWLDWYNAVLDWIAAHPLVGQGTDPNTPGG